MVPGSAIRGLALMFAAATLAFVTLPSNAAAAPPNDNFPGTTISSLPFTDTVDTAGATDEPGEPFCGANLGLAVWYSYTPATDGFLRAELTGSISYGFIGVHAGDSLASLTCAAAGGYIPPPDELSQPAVFEATGGVTYRFQVGVGGFPAQTGVLTFTLSEGTPPANDDFPGIEITELPFTHTADTTYATSDGQASVIGPTVWYNYTPEEDVELWADTLDSDYNAVIALRDFEGNAPSGADQEFWDCEILDQGLFYRAKAGETLYFQVGGKHIGDTGNLVFNLKEYDGTPELVCWGRLGPPYDGYTNYPHQEPPGPSDGSGGDGGYGGGDTGAGRGTPTVAPAALPTAGAPPPSGGWGEAALLGGALALLASGALLLRARRR